MYPHFPQKMLSLAMVLPETLQTRLQRQHLWVTSLMLDLVDVSRKGHLSKGKGACRLCNVREDEAGTNLRVFRTFFWQQVFVCIV